MLLFYVGQECYALDCEHILEVVPRVNLKPISHAPKYVAGLLNFRGVPVPVVDLCQLLEGRPSSSRLHTRIVILRHEEHTFGIIVEQLTETMYRKKEDFVDAGVRMKEIPYLGGVFTEKDTTIQLVLFDALFSALKGELFSQVE